MADARADLLDRLTARWRSIRVPVERTFIHFHPTNWLEFPSRVRALTAPPTFRTGRGSADTAEKALGSSSVGRCRFECTSDASTAEPGESTPEARRACSKPGLKSAASAVAADVNRAAEKPGARLVAKNGVPPKQGPKPEKIQRAWEEKKDVGTQARTSWEYRKSSTEKKSAVEGKAGFAKEWKASPQGLRYFEKVEVGIKDDESFRVVQRLIGPRGKHTRNICDKCPGAKIWIIGRGSRSWEDDSGPLRICVGASTQDTYDSAKCQVLELLERVRAEYRNSFGD